MLISIKTENFKSYGDAATLSMLATSKITSHPTHKIAVKDLKVLRNAVIYGANASGKSNIIELFAYLQYCLKNELPFGSKLLFSKTKDGNENKPSLFEICFSLKDKIYDYGFRAVLKDRKIMQEWLYEIKGDNVKALFESDVEIEPKTDIRFVNKQDRDRFNVYSLDYKTQTTKLFLTALARNKKYEIDSALSIFSDIYQYLTSDIIIYHMGIKPTDFKYIENEEKFRAVEELLGVFDTGITTAKLRDISLDTFRETVGDDVAREAIEELRKMNAIHNNNKGSLTMRSDRDFYRIRSDEQGEFHIKTIQTKHQNPNYFFEFFEESEGTRRVFDLIDMLLTDKDDITFVVDELERSLHPKLTEKFVELFNRINSDKRNQLIFSTHESNIMAEELFRRDEIWFVERNNLGVSRLYSLDRFKERNDKRYNKAYLEGRYGAVPIFKNFDCFDGKSIILGSEVTL